MKATRNPNSEPVEDKVTGQIEVERVEHPDTLYYKGDFYQLGVTVDQLSELQAKDPITRWQVIVRKLRLQPEKMPPRSEIGGFYRADGENILKQIEGDRLRRNLASGRTLEQVVEKAHGKKASDPEFTRKVIEKTVDVVNSGALDSPGFKVTATVAGHTYPPSNPRHPDHQEWLQAEAKRRKRSVASLKASEEKRRKEQEAKKGEK